jgi:D-tyrosyl-tRNA(Tyr) deacylase
MRPGFSTAASAEQARALFDYLLQRAHACHAPVASGEFGSHMRLSLTNDGPVTFWLETNPAER